jgi:hypothetical protein
MKKRKCNKQERLRLVREALILSASASGATLTGPIPLSGGGKRKRSSFEFGIRKEDTIEIESEKRLIHFEALS